MLQSPIYLIITEMINNDKKFFLKNKRTGDRQIVLDSE
jgi:hypothetical protein